MSYQDVDWKDDLTFATCSTDKAIHTCVVGEKYPRQTFTGQLSNDALNWLSDDCHHTDL